MIAADDVLLLQIMASDYERRADEFERSEAQMRSRLNDDSDVGVLNSRDMMVDFLASYERRRYEAVRKASLLRRLLEIFEQAGDA